MGALLKVIRNIIVEQLGCKLLLFHCNYVLSCNVFETFKSNNSMHLKSGLLGVIQRLWKLHHSIQRIRFPIWSSIVTMALPRIVSEIQREIAISSFDAPLMEKNCGKVLVSS